MKQSQHGGVKTSCYALHWIDAEKNKTNKFPKYSKGYADMNPHLWSKDDHQIILDKIEAWENLNHDEYMADENYYDVDSDDSDDDDN